PLFGREPEIAQLMGCFSRLDDRLAQVVSIVGDAGSGKSRLIYEFKKRLADEEVHVLEGRCSSLTRGVPYKPWKMMMRGLFKLENEACGPAEAERVCCCVEEMLGVEHAEIAPHLCSMLSLPQPTPIAPVEKVKQPWFGAVASLVGRMAKQKPVVMILEDLHWIDDASLEMLEMAVAACNTEAIMVVVTHRPDFQPQWQSQAASTQLHLRLLSPEHARQIVRARVGGELPASLEDRILKKGEGNPFFLEELTRGLMEEGAFVASEGRVEVTRPVESIRIPDTVQELLGARLDRLEPGAKRVAQIASVFGRQFKGDQLRELVADGGNGIDVASELAELEQRGVIHRSGLASDQFRFGESLTQEVAYEGLLLRERRQLHAQVGQMLLRSTEGSDGSSLALIGHHLARSEEREKGLLTLLEAADQALDMPSYGDAIRLYLECWELADSAVEESHNGDGKLREAALRAVLGYLQVAMIFGESRAQKVEHAIARGLELAQELDDADAIASIHGLRGTILMNSDRERFNDGIALIEKGVEVARNAGLERRVAQLSRSLSWAYLGDGLFQEARRSIDEVFKTLERLGEGGAHSDTYLGARFFENRILIESDHYSEARASLQETFELASSGSNRTIETASAAQLSTVYFRLGEYEQAERMAEHGMEVSQEIDSPAATRTCSIVQLGIRFLRDPSSIALAELDRFDTRLDSGSDVSQNLDLIIELLLGIGEVERAGQLAQKGVERSGGRLRDARNLLSVGRVASRRGPAHAMSAQKHLLKALEIAREIGIRSVIAHALIALAELAELRGETPDRASLEEARGIFEDLKLKHYAPRVRSLLEAN
ncbi:MAG: AAA family ATPase, partial [bacterium]|nr:AAA family ATPase [bacterium]